MKKQLVLLAAFFVAAVAQAQTTITVDKALGTPSELTQLTEGLYKGADGLAFISDVRSDKGEGFGGLIHEKATKYFKADGKVVMSEAAINFQKVPTGLQNKNGMIPTKVPYNRAVEFKPASDGKLYAMVWSKKPQGRLFYAVANNGIYEMKEFKMWEKGSTAGSKDNPYEALELDYTYTEGDVVFLFATGPLYLSGIHYTGSADTTFEGAMPKQIVDSKKMAKLAKQRAAASE
ncbi:MAG: hypothetical protein J5610_05185 [Prevotella sp.]|nr:hypothetical protein [Prevotella sp.]